MGQAGRTLLLFLLAAAAASCGRGEEAGSAKPREATPALSVRVASVRTRDVAYTVKALGSLEADELVQIAAQVDGAVTQILFHEGDRVLADTLLARIDPERYRLEAASAEAAQRKALADWQRAEADMRRREALAEERLVAVEELNRARQETERLAADVAAAKVALEIALQNRERSDVRPPRAGVINTRSVDTGQFVRMGTVLATLVDPARLRLRFPVSAAESLRTRKGQTVSFGVAALGARQFSAQVYHVGSVADPATRQVEVLAWVQNPGALKPGFFAEVTLAAESHKNAVVVPEGAVQASERGFVSYVVEGGRARQRPVQIGMRTGDAGVEILSGLEVGETIVTEGSDRLADGIAVAPVPPAEGGSSAPVRP